MDFFSAFGQSAAYVNDAVQQSKIFVISIFEENRQILDICQVLRLYLQENSIDTAMLIQLCKEANLALSSTAKHVHTIHSGYLQALLEGMSNESQ